MQVLFIVDCVCFERSISLVFFGSIHLSMIAALQHMSKIPFHANFGKYYLNLKFILKMRTLFYISQESFETQRIIRKIWCTLWLCQFNGVYTSMNVRNRCNEGLTASWTSCYTTLHSTSCC